MHKPVLRGSYTNTMGKSTRLTDAPSPFRYCFKTQASMFRIFIRPSAALRDIVDGSNGDFKAGKGWDACTGLGSPIGTAVMKALEKGSIDDAPLQG
jgi:hypothetical protein